MGKNFPATINGLKLRKPSSSFMAATKSSMEFSNNLYEILSLDSDKKVGIEEIKKAYRCKALKFHPDTCSLADQEESTRRFMEINMAYETLSDPITREMYDYEIGLWESSSSSSSSSRGFSLSRETWQRQLGGLKKRSVRRMEKKGKTCT